MSRITFQALYEAYLTCRRRKRLSANTQRYEMQLLDNLHDTADALHRRNYQPKRSLCFVAKQPKARQIHAADFSDRVVHHWLVPKLEALYEPISIVNSAALRSKSIEVVELDRRYRGGLKHRFVNNIQFNRSIL